MAWLLHGLGAPAASCRRWPNSGHVWVLIGALPFQTLQNCEDVWLDSRSGCMQLPALAMRLVVPIGAPCLQNCEGGLARF